MATTKAQRKLFFNLRSAKKRLGWFNHEEVEAVARDLGVKAETVYEMESRLSGHDIAFDPSPDQDNDEYDSIAPASYLEDEEADPAQLIEKVDWADQTQQKLQAALATLDQRSRDILQRRWLAEQKPTLQALADEYKVSAERIRQLESAALKKLQQQLV